MDKIQSFLQSPKWRNGDVLKEYEVVSKEQVHEQDLLHLSVHLLIIDRQNRILCRQRQKDDFRYANLWTSSIGTHVLFGSNYKSTLLPMLPANNEIKFVGEFRVHDAWENEVNGLFIMNADSKKLPEIFLKDREFISLSKLTDLINNNQTTPHLKGAIELLHKERII